MYFIIHVLDANSRSYVMPMKENSKSTRHQLSAVLFADIVGFTSMSTKDEKQTIQLVEKFELASKNAVNRNQGKLVKFLGDGVLAYFSSTDAAVRAALQLRSEFSESASVNSEDSFLYDTDNKSGIQGDKRSHPTDSKLRIGIHIGDILIRQDDDILGDGVNIASRVMSHAEAGEIIVSEDVWKQLRRRNDFTFTDKGLRQLKGIPEAVRLFTVSELPEGYVTIHQFAENSFFSKNSFVRHIKYPIIATIIVLICFLGYSFFFKTDVVYTESPITSLVVLPFDNLSQTPDEDYFAFGIHDALIGELNEIGSIRVISRTSAIRYAGTTKSLSEIANELQVDAVLAASLVKSDNLIRIRAELIKVNPREESLWTGSFDREMENVLYLQTDMAKALTEAIRLQLTSTETARLDRRESVNPDAYQAYLRGRFYWELHTAADLDRAYRFFNLALNFDPGYAPAWAGIASVWYGRRQLGLSTPDETNRRVTAAAQKALEFDPNLARAYHALAIESAWHDYNWDQAKTYFEKALELNPGDAGTRAFYSLVLRISGYLEESIYHANVAAKADPFNPIIQGISIINHSFYEDFDNKVNQLYEVLQDSPDHPVTLTNLSLMLHHSQRYEEAIDVTKRLFEVTGDNLIASVIESVSSSQGYHDTMKAIADALVSRTSDAYIPPTRIAQFYIRAGEVDLCLDWLEKAAGYRDHGLAYIGSPQYNPLHQHERFQKLLEFTNISI